MSLRERKAAQRKESIIHSALSVIAEKGYHRTTLEDIAENLLMTRGSVYYYFKDKQDLVYQSQILIMNNSLQNIKNIEKCELPIIEKVKLAMVTHIKYAVSYQAGFELMIKPDQLFEGEQLIHILELRDKYAKFFDQFIQEGIDTGVIYPLNIKIARNLILGAMNWITHWYSLEGEINEDEISKLISRYLIKIFICEKG